jgi:LysM repeat protein
MKPTTCPYLSIIEDPEVQLAFPSLQNCCRRARPVESANLEYQSKYCLTPNYVNCSVPTNDINTPLPEGIRAVVPGRNRKLTFMIVVIVMVVGFLAIGIWQSGFLGRLLNPLLKVTKTQTEIFTTPSPMPTMIVNTPTSLISTSYTQTVIPTVIPTLVPTNSPTPLKTPSDTPTMLATPSKSPTLATTESVCNPPAGWVSYTVQPNESLNQIALKFNMTVAELQEANCMGQSVVIYPGQVIYVPNVPTRTPPRYSTRIPTRTPSPTKRDVPHTQTPTPNPTDTPRPSVTLSPTDTPRPSPTKTITPPPLPTHTFTPPAEGGIKSDYWVK